MATLDHTHQADAQSWIESANLPDCDFPLQHLPLCIFRAAGSHEVWRPGVGIGEYIVSLEPLAFAGLLDGLTQAVIDACAASTLNTLFATGRCGLLALRHRVWELLHEDGNYRAAVGECLFKQSDAEFDVPCAVGDYTDFFASQNHARNTFRIFRPGHTFLPNFDYVPIAYHGRASSIIVSGSDVRRPNGQMLPGIEPVPVFGASHCVDWEVELGFYIGSGNVMGRPVTIDEAESQIIGFSVLNDWSARDLQRWESQPLGPFLSKNFATSVSPWVTTFDALQPFRSALPERVEGAAKPLQYLTSDGDALKGTFDITFETWLQSACMDEPVLISTTGLLESTYWTPLQMVAHHTVNGCNLRPGDLIGSGTISGPRQGSQGCLVELTEGGTIPIHLGNGEQRRFLEDGDLVTVKAWCQRDGFRRIGLGSCIGQVVGATEI